LTEIETEGKFDPHVHEPLVRTLGERGLLACVPLAVIVELRGEPLQPVEELIAVSLESVDIDALLGLFRYLRLIRHYAFGASCSSSMTS
jgi:sirohydrochlorin ferrochelatase